MLSLLARVKDDTENKMADPVYLQLERNIDGNKIYGIGGGMYASVQLWNGRITYSVWVSLRYVFS